MTSSGADGAHPHAAKRDDIDGLRALAVCLVLLVHSFPQYMPKGFIGVDIFFVISGFLITGILARELREGRFSLWSFYTRRVNRIFPALILVLVACVGFGWLALYADEFKLLGRSVAAGSGFAANINFFLETGYWDIASKLKPLLHLWSLGVEEQFYLAWPLLLWAAWMLGLNIAIVLAALVTGSLAWNLWVTPIDQAATFYLPFSRIWELLAGASLACAADRIANMPKLMSNACSFFGVALIVAALLGGYPDQEFPGWHVILPVLGATLIIAAGPAAWLNVKLFSHPWIVYVGLISYPLYLWHWPLLSFARILDNGELSDAGRNIALTLAVVLAAGTYHLVERRLSRHSGRQAITLSLALLACAVGGYLIYRDDGVPSRYATAPAPAMDALPAAASTAKVALLGDSNAFMFLPAFNQVFGSRLIPMATAGWPYLIGTDYRPGMALHRLQTGTPSLTDEAMARITADRAIDTVVIAHMYIVYMDQDQLRSVPPVAGENSASAYEAGLRRTATLLTGAGKTVVYVKSIPFFGGSIASVTACSSSALPVHRKRPPGCRRPIDDVQKQRQAYDQLVGRAFDGIQRVAVFDPLPFLCDDRFCYVEKDGTMMYADVSHLTTAGTIPVAIDLANLIEERRKETAMKAAHNDSPF